MESRQIKIKHLIQSIKTGLNPRSNFILGQGNNYYVTTKNLDGRQVILDEKCDNITDEALRKINSRSDLRVGDILFSGIGTIGRTAIIEKPANNWNISESLYSLRPNKLITTKFLYYVLNGNKMEDYYLHYQTGSAQKGLRMEDLKNFKADVFDLETQNRITDFLDKKTSSIMAIIEEEEKELTNLRMFRKRLIAENVSTGTVFKLKHIFDYVGSGSTPESSNSKFYDGDINWIQSGDIYQKEQINFVERKITRSGYESSNSLKVLKAPFIVVAMYGASIGNSAISNIDACSNQACCSLSKLKKDFDLDYIYYCICDIKDYFLENGNGGTQPNINKEIIKNAKIRVPSLSEQQKIADYLKKYCKSIDELIEKKKEIINKLFEYKKSLIYECVSGRRTV